MEITGSRNGTQSSLIMTSDLSLSVVKLQLTRQLQSPSDHPKCLTLSLLPRLAVAGIITVGNILMLIAITTDYWIHGHNKKNDLLHMGLWNICIQAVCKAHHFVLYSNVILLVTIVFGICCNIVAVVALVYGVTDIKRWIARTMSVTGILAVCGMASATQLLTILTIYQSIGFSFVLGWIGTVLYLVTALVSWIHYKIQPDTGMTLNDIRHLVSKSTTEEPSYT